LLNAESASTGEIIVTNDGATILKSISLDNPAAKILVNISKVQDDEVGDGTTSVCVLASELLREGERLVNMKIHPQTIIEGYRIASKAALDALEAAAQDHSCVLPSSPCRLAWAALALREAASLSSPPLAAALPAPTPPPSGPTSSTSPGRRSRQRSSRRTRTTLPTSPSTPSSGSRSVDRRPSCSRRPPGVARAQLAQVGSDAYKLDLG
jgi:hypothetical protein